MHLMRPLRRVLGAVRQRLLGAFFALADRILPVRHDYWSFCTWTNAPHTLDNPRALFEEVKNDPSIRKIILQKYDRSEPVREGRNVTFVPVESFRGAWLLARSRVLVLGYGLRGVSSYIGGLRAKKHCIVQLWHGIPLKKIGRLFPGESFWADETPMYCATVASSPQDREVMSRAFAPLPLDRVWDVGLPRNDTILKGEALLPADHRGDLARLDEMARGRRLVLYAPTWREKKDEESIYLFSEQEEQRLRAVLERHNAVLAIRGHPNVRHLDAFGGADLSHQIVSVNEFSDVNVLLRRVEVLVTDYSSIYIDYLLVDRPVIHFVYDMDSYILERGFLHDPQTAFAGAAVRTFSDLLKALDEALRDPGHGAAQRAQARRLFHAHGEHPSAQVRLRIEELLQSRSIGQ